eukprot:g2527.t1
MGVHGTIDRIAWQRKAANVRRAKQKERIKNALLKRRQQLLSAEGVEENVAKVVGNHVEKRSKELDDHVSKYLSQYNENIRTSFNNPFAIIPPYLSEVSDSHHHNATQKPQPVKRKDKNKSIKMMKEFNYSDLPVHEHHKKLFKGRHEKESLEDQPEQDDIIHVFGNRFKGRHAKEHHFSTLDYDYENYYKEDEKKTKDSKSSIVKKEKTLNDSQPRSFSKSKSKSKTQYLKDPIVKDHSVKVVAAMFPDRKKESIVGRQYRVTKKIHMKPCDSFQMMSKANISELMLAQFNEENGLRAKYERKIRRRIARQNPPLKEPLARKKKLIDEKKQLMDQLYRLSLDLETQVQEKNRRNGMRSGVPETCAQASYSWGAAGAHKNKSRQRNQKKPKFRRSRGRRRLEKEFKQLNLWEDDDYLKNNDSIATNSSENAHHKKISKCQSQSPVNYNDVEEAPLSLPQIGKKDWLNSVTKRYFEREKKRNRSDPLLYVDPRCHEFKDKLKKAIREKGLDSGERGRRIAEMKVKLYEAENVRNQYTYDFYDDLRRKKEKDLNLKNAFSNYHSEGKRIGGGRYY